MNLKEIEIENQIWLCAFVVCKKQTHKNKAVDFLYVNFSLSQAMAPQGWHELWRHIKCVCASPSCLWDIWYAWGLKCFLLFHRISVLLLLPENTAQAAQQIGKDPFAFWASNCGRAGATTALAFAHGSCQPVQHPAGSCQPLPGRRNTISSDPACFRNFPMASEYPCSSASTKWRIKLPCKT